MSDISAICLRLQSSLGDADHGPVEPLGSILAPLDLFPHLGLVRSPTRQAVRRIATFEQPRRHGI
jgi:hypothetical protein